MPLTDTAIKTAKPTEKTQKFFDGGGLYLEISPNGGKWWRLKYRFGGKEKRLSLGVYPVISLKNARDRRDEARRRAGWTLVCSILAHDADSRGDTALFLLAGFEAVLAMRQSRRGMHHNRAATHRADSLDTLIAGFLDRHPGTTPNALFDHLASNAGLSDVVADYDADRGILVCQLDPGNERLSDVTREAFTRRVDRIRKQCPAK